jgi:hypothetical protein
VFSNSNPVPSRVTALKFVNEYEKSLLLVGSNDGIIRVSSPVSSSFCSLFSLPHVRYVRWQGVDSADTLRLVLTWRELPEATTFFIIFKYKFFNFF